MPYSQSPLPLYLLRYKSQKGFTLIELLVVVIIIGILSALALPAMLDQSVKAKQAAAKSYVGAVNRAQQAYRLQNLAFASNMTQLEASIPLATAAYNYSFGLTTSTLAEFKASPTDDLLDAYSGCTRVDLIVGQDAKTSASVKEEAATGGGTPATPPNC